MRLSLPTTGPRSLKRMTIASPSASQHLSAFVDSVYALPASWRRRIREFAAHGLEIHIDPFRMYPEQLEENWDEFADSWPKDPDAASEPHELDRFRRPASDIDDT
ncbi:hypothetical protein C8R43DRAFT_1133050 [Mycena crocata]|nr:hypothetical protein C8R43DRAFT_1133050 [Mycena crocata]